jgi:hypothetical protein
MWAVFQERVGSTDYVTVNELGEETARERFKAIPVLNLVQALFASALAYVVMLLRKQKPALPLMSYVGIATTHTISSPIG